MAWCHQAKSHYVSQCWPRSMWPYDVTTPQWVNTMRPEQNGWDVADNKFKCIFLTWYCMQLDKDKDGTLDETDKRHPIAHLWGGAMGCLLLVLQREMTLRYLTLPALKLEYSGLTRAANVQAPCLTKSTAAIVLTYAGQVVVFNVEGYKLPSPSQELRDDRKYRYIFHVSENSLNISRVNSLRLSDAYMHQ